MTSLDHIRGNGPSIGRRFSRGGGSRRNDGATFKCLFIILTAWVRNANSGYWLGEADREPSKGGGLCKLTAGRGSSTT